MEGKGPFKALDSGAGPLCVKVFSTSVIGENMDVVWWEALRGAELFWAQVPELTNWGHCSAGQGSPSVGLGAPPNERQGDG